MAQCQRRGQKLAVVFIDIDGFKSVNDQHGHDAGDHMLVSVANRMRGMLREGDTSPGWAATSLSQCCLTCLTSATACRRSSACSLRRPGRSEFGGAVFSVGQHRRDVLPAGRGSVGRSVAAPG